MGWSREKEGRDEGMGKERGKRGVREEGGREGAKGREGGGRRQYFPFILDW